MYKRLYGDFETASKCDLLTRGAYIYARDPSTHILCFAYAFDDEPIEVWIPGQPFPERIKQHIRDGGQLYFHNSNFDRLIFWYILCPDFDIPEPPIEAFHCTAAQAAGNCLPRGLADVGRAIKSDLRKDHRGAQLIRLLSLPQPDGTFNRDPVLMHEMIEYCRHDVATMRAVSKGLRQLTDDEHRDFVINERTNDLGVMIDVDLCRAAIRYSDAETKEIQALVADITEGAVTTVRSPRMREWVHARVGPEAQKLMRVYKDGEAKESIDKNVRENLLQLAEENPDEVPPDVADVIQCASDIWASSVAKFTQLANRADVEDQRLRGALVFNGGAATGRLASYNAQLHNLGRTCAKQPEDVCAAMLRGDSLSPEFGACVTDVLKGMLRPALIPALGNVFVTSDWNAIEARVNPWLSAELSAEPLLDIFRRGDDVYVNAAMKLYGCAAADVTSVQRQMEKIKILACGFAGGVGAFAAMGRAYGVRLPESDALRAVNAWRRANPWAVQFWGKIESAYTRAMRNPGHEFAAGRVVYLYDKENLWFRLPSGRILCYPQARWEDGEITYLKASWKPKNGDTEWPRAHLWRGLAVESITQATANDLLRHVCRKLDGIVLTIHDEVVIECAAADAPAVAQHVSAVMCEPPEWCESLPLSCGTKILQRFGK